MVTLRLVPLLLLAGCAANQSAFPMPAPFEAAEDAPIFLGQPGTATPESERSPHKRLLPQTPESQHEAGLWAGDRPRASSDNRPMIWDVEIPIPRPEAVLFDVRVCTTAFNDALYRRPDLMMLAKHPPSDRKMCFAVALFASCMRASASSPEDASRILKHVEDVTAKRCAPLRKDVEQIVSEVLVEVVKPSSGGNGGGNGLH